MIDAAEAGAIGLVNHVVPADELLPKAYEIAQSIAALPPMAVRLNKKGIRLGMGSELDAQRRYEELSASILGRTEDAREARLAFREKRDPIYTGR